MSVDKRPLVGSKIILLKDNAEATSEKKDTILTVTGHGHDIHNFYTNDSFGIPNCWTFRMKNEGYSYSIYSQAVTSPTSTPQVQKYMIGDKLYSNLNGMEYEIYDYDKSTGYYAVIQPGQIYGASRYNEAQLNHYFSRANPSYDTLLGGYGATGASPNIPTNGAAIQARNTGWIKINYIPELGEAPTILSFQEKKNCDCGGNKTYGVNSGPEDHSSWCSKFSGSKA